MSILSEKAKFVLLACFFMAAQPFVVRYTQNSDGGYDYLVLSVSLMVEAVKLIVSINCYAALVEPEAQTHRILSQRDILRFSIPGIAYTINNALLFVIVQKIKPTLFQIVSTTKTVFTALFFRIFMKRILLLPHYATITLLATGTAVSRLSEKKCPVIPSILDSASGYEGYEGYEEYEEYDEFKEINQIQEYETYEEGIGIALTLITCICSSLGGVLNEVLLKREGAVHSLFLQNALLYSWCVVLNLMALCILNFHQIFMETGPFIGFDRRVLLLIIMNSAMGLSISYILKHLDNLVRVVAHTCAMVISMVVESVLLLHWPSLPLSLAIIIVSASSLLYSLQTPPQPALQQPTLVVRN